MNTPDVENLITPNELWKAISGNPGIEPTKQDALDAARLCAEAVDAEEEESLLKVPKDVTVSVDVSKGEDDAQDRIFALTTGEVLYHDGEPVILAIEDERNFGVKVHGFVRGNEYIGASETLVVENLLKNGYTPVTKVPPSTPFFLTTPDEIHDKAIEALNDAQTRIVELCMTSDIPYPMATLERINVAIESLRGLKL